MTIWPSEVRRDHEARLLRIRWQDGHVSDYEYDMLRGYCPCAMCQGHNAGPLRYRPPERPVIAQTVSQVGNYALGIAWSDGHWTGIYRFDLLRRLCPCADCRASRGQGGSAAESEGGPRPLRTADPGLGTARPGAARPRRDAAE